MATPRRNLLNALPAIATLTVGAASFALSYVALSEVAAEVGAVPAHMSWLVPIVIDGGIIAGSAVIWDQSRDGRRRQVFPFLFVAALVIVSVIVNVNHAAANLLAQGIAALPPLVLLGSLEIVASQHRRRHLSELVANSTAAGQEAAAPAAPARAQSTAQTGVAPAPAAAPAVAPAPASAPAVDTDRPVVQKKDTPTPGAPTDIAAPAARQHAREEPAQAPEPEAAAKPTKPARQPLVAATPAGEADLDLGADTTATDQLLDALLADVDADAPVKEAVLDVFTRFVQAGGDPYDRQVTGHLARHFDSSTGYIANVIRPVRAAQTEATPA